MLLNLFLFVYTFPSISCSLDFIFPYVSMLLCIYYFIERQKHKCNYTYKYSDRDVTIAMGIGIDRYLFYLNSMYKTLELFSKVRRVTLANLRFPPSIFFLRHESAQWSFPSLRHYIRFPGL